MDQHHFSVNRRTTTNCRKESIEKYKCLMKIKHKTIQIVFIDIYKHRNNGKNKSISHDKRLVIKNNIIMEFLFFKSGNLVINVYIDLQIKIILLWSHKTTQVK